jgi:arylamine N-acetyltransferase
MNPINSHLKEYAIPFENLDVLLRRPIVLDPQRLANRQAHD